MQILFSHRERREMLETFGVRLTPQPTDYMIREPELLEVAEAFAALERAITRDPLAVLAVLRPAGERQQQ